jgi:FtsZ-interacting cell division protein YlmF
MDSRGVLLNMIGLLVQGEEAEEEDEEEAEEEVEEAAQEEEEDEEEAAEEEEEAPATKRVHVYATARDRGSNVREHIGHIFLAIVPVPINTKLTTSTQRVGLDRSSRTVSKPSSTRLPCSTS